MCNSWEYTDIKPDEPLNDLLRLINSLVLMMRQDALKLGSGNRHFPYPTRISQYYQSVKWSGGRQGETRPSTTGTCVFQVFVGDFTLAETRDRLERIVFHPQPVQGRRKTPQIDHESGRIGIFQLYNEGCFPSESAPIDLEEIETCPKPVVFDRVPLASCVLPDRRCSRGWVWFF